MSNLKNPSQPRWYALYTEPRAEKKVFRELELRGFETYLPLQTTLRQWSDRKKKVEVPLFNSYIFVRTELEKNYFNILNIPGVVKFIKMGSETVSIRDEQISYIRLFLSEFDELTVLSSSPLEIHQAVEVIAGPFRGMQGILTEHKGTRHFAIEIEQLGSNILVNLPEKYLRPL